MVVWKELSRKGKNLPVLLMSFIGRAFTLVPVVHGFSFEPKLYRQFDSSRWLDENDYEAWQNALREKEEAQPGWLLSVMTDFEEALKEFKTVAERVSKEFEREPDASNAQLASWFSEFAAAGAKTIAFDYDYYFMNNFYVDPLFAEIAEKEKNAENQNEFLKTLLSPSEFSDTSTEKEGLLRIAEKIAANASDVRADENEIRRLAERHAERFAYTGLFYFERSPLTAGEVVERARHLVETGVEKERERLKQQKAVPEKTVEIIERLQLSEGARLRVKTLKKTSFDTNFFDESWNYSCFKMLPLVNEIALRLRVSYAQLIELTEEEIKTALLAGGVSGELASEAVERGRDHALFVESRRVAKILTGAALDEYGRSDQNQNAKLLTLPASNSGELHGLCASPGIARGRVRILLRPEEIPLLQKGEILVAKATTPSFVPAMEKAAALVAEQGGLLCHTAIVGRELGVPTVVGVKHATLALKNGDLIEVDATKGTVKKL